ncbi:MAG: hypothetical protein KDD64_01790 [Bdellovibrionales bacterium]|nr:hypothetical protein [Bdellovibrionales bacterium]
MTKFDDRAARDPFRELAVDDPLSDQRVLDFQAHIIGLVEQLANPEESPEKRDLAKQELEILLDDRFVQARIIQAYAGTLDPGSAQRVIVATIGAELETSHRALLQNLRFLEDLSGQMDVEKALQATRRTIEPSPRSSDPTIRHLLECLRAHSW